MASGSVALARGQMLSAPLGLVLLSPQKQSTARKGQQSQMDLFIRYTKVSQVAVCATLLGEVPWAPGEGCAWRWWAQVSEDREWVRL